MPRKNVKDIKLPDVRAMDVLEAHSVFFSECLFLADNLTLTNDSYFECCVFSYKSELYSAERTSYFDNCVFEKCKFYNLKIDTVRFDNCIFKDCTFNNSNFLNCRIKESIFYLCDFSNNIFSFTIFTNVRFLHTNISFSDGLKNVSWKSTGIQCDLEAIVCFALQGRPNYNSSEYTIKLGSLKEEDKIAIVKHFKNTKDNMLFTGREIYTISKEALK